MNKDVLFSISIKNSKLPRSSAYSQLDEEIKNEFSKRNIYISPDTPIIKKQNKTQWRIAMENGNNVRAFAIELDFNRNDDTEIISVYEDTLSGFPKNIWDFKIFYSGMLNSKTNRKLSYDGSVRRNLNTKQKKKWDYFFKPDFNIVEKRFIRLEEDYERELKHAESKLQASNFYIFGLIGLISSIFFIGSTEIFGTFESVGYLVILSLITLVFGAIFLLKLAQDKISINHKKLKNEINVIKSYLIGFKNEKEKLKAQLEDRNVPSTNEILKWLQEETNELHSIVKSKYLFDEKEKKEWKKLKSFAIYQPEFKTITKQFPKQIDTFFAFKYIQDELIYSGQFFIFLFLTDNKICISKLFYDFILGKKYKEENKEYHFTDLVGIAINSTIINDPFNEHSSANEEESAIWMSFIDSNSIQIVIINDDISSDIVRRLENQVDKKTTLTLESLEEEITLDKQTLHTTTMSEAMKIVHWIKEKKKYHTKKP